MTPADREALASRMRAEAQRDRVARIARQMRGDPEAWLAVIDDDRQWFIAWTGALGVGARCPSIATRAAVREAIRQRLPPLAEVFRDELAELERAREAGMEVWKP